MNLTHLRKLSLVLIGVSAVICVASVVQATPISFSGSYDGSYDPYSPTGGEDAWVKGTATIDPVYNSDHGTYSYGVADFNDNGTSTRIQVSRQETFSSDQSLDEYVYSTRIKFDSTGLNSDDYTTRPFAAGIGFRDESNGTDGGKAVLIGWTAYYTGDSSQPGLWLIDDNFYSTSAKITNYDFFDDEWYTYTVKKFIDTDNVTKVNVSVTDDSSNVIADLTVNYSALPDSALNSGGFGFWSYSQRTSRATVDYFAYEGYQIPEPTTLALLATGLIGLLAYAWRKRK